MTKSLRVLSPSLAKPFVSFTRPSSQDRDQDQYYKTKTKTEFDCSETCLAKRPKSQTTSLIQYKHVLYSPLFTRNLIAIRNIVCVHFTLTFIRERSLRTQRSQVHGNARNILLFFEASVFHFLMAFPLSS